MINRIQEYKEIVWTEETQKSKFQDLKDDTIIKQTFTCCNHINQIDLWEGWDRVSDTTVDEKDFVYCPALIVDIS